jgi:flagellar biosynthesis GTPase FlhF
MDQHANNLLQIVNAKEKKSKPIAWVDPLEEENHGWNGSFAHQIDFLKENVNRSKSPTQKIILQENLQEVLRENDIMKALNYEFNQSKQSINLNTVNPNNIISDHYDKFGHHNPRTVIYLNPQNWINQSEKTIVLQIF